MANLGDTDIGKAAKEVGAAYFTGGYSAVAEGVKGKDVNDTWDSVSGKTAKKNAASAAAGEAQAALDVKTAGDNAAIADIASKQGAAADKIVTIDTEAQNTLKDLSTKLGDATTAATGTLGDLKDKTADAVDSLKKLTAADDPKALADKLSADQDTITKQKMDLANATLDQSKKLAGLYSQLTTSYQDVAQKYADAVTGLSDSEKTSLKGQAMQDFSAMSAVGAQGANAVMRGSGSPVTGNMAAVLSAQSQQGASSAYASAMSRMQDLDQQRRVMQLTEVTSSLDEQRANVGTAGSLMSTEIGFAAGARSEMAGDLQYGQDTKAKMKLDAMSTSFQQGLASYGAELGGIYTEAGLVQQGYADTASSYGTQASLATSGAAYASDAVTTKLGADTYADVAGIQERAGTYGSQIGIQNYILALQQQGKAESARTGGAIVGAAGAVVGGIYGGPAGAGAGYQVGQGVGQAAGGA